MTATDLGVAAGVFAVAGLPDPAVLLLALVVAALFAFCFVAAAAFSLFIDSIIGALHGS